MAVNTLSFNQLSSVLGEITQQATGGKVLTPVNTGEFISVAQTALATGYDPLATAISQVLSRTIFSIRPYYRKFGGLMVDEVRYGNHVRKLQSIDKPFENDDRFLLEDGKSVDQQKVNKPQVLQTNFYGANVFQKSQTIYRDQLDNAFSGVDEFGRFLSMIMQNALDMIEQAHESVARATLANLIAGINESNPANQVVHLLTEYNTLNGLNLTSTTVYEPDNFAPFMRWVFSKVATVSDMLTERSLKYHTNITDKPINRHTPKRDQRAYLTSQVLNMIDASVLTDTFHDNYLNFGEYERVTYWQSIENPDEISVTPTYLDADGSLTTSSDTVEVSNIFGIIMDVEAAGITTVNQWSAPAPFNARGGYTNMFWHFTDRYWNDFTENAVIFLLD